ncbi:hypothetical protein FB471_5728 [Amycolatopsis cihanbeyliensis]|uniref:Uncharacterized protein n=1 Tax=Amycolatopsis cihanbeyliensis TaxID=1128664 RepID=A0A542DRX9_AMYCI|nr:hypothetical protein FB471_5728 [Amycolatopsis cihanbeyliensis]
MALGVTAVLLAAGGVGGYLLWSEPVPHTWEGETVAKAGGVLRAAEWDLAALAQDRDGVVNDDTRCYFAAEGEPEGDAVAVRPEVWCGAVYLPDSEQGAYWLRTDVSKGERTDGGVRLEVAPIPEGARTQRLPDGVELSRPDGRDPAGGDGGLVVPPAPPAGADLLRLLEPGAAQRQGIAPPKAEEPVVMRGWGYGVEITGHGELDRFGRGEAVRAPAQGHRLLALAITGIEGESADAEVERLILEKGGERQATRDTSLRVRIGEDERALPGARSLSAGAERVLLVSVPRGAGTADLVLAERGLRQTVSLVTGEAGEDNPAVLGRADVSTDLASLSGELTVRARAGDRFADSTASYQLVSARLAYYRGYGARQHAAKDSAYLLLWGDMEVFDEGRSLIPEWITMRLPDGSTREAKNLTDRDDYVWIAIEVPADFTHGTLVFKGALEFDNGMSVSVVREKEEKLSIQD